MREWKLTKKTLYLWDVYAVLVFFVVAVLTTAITYYRPMISVIVILSAAAVLMLVMFVYLPALWRGVTVRLSDTALSYSVGLFINREHILPLDRFLFTEKVNTPLSSLFKMCYIRVQALGGFLLMPPVENELAEEIITRCGRRQ